MGRERKEKNLVIAFLLVAVVSLSVAFAATLSTPLNINGTANLGDAKWDVHFASATQTAASTLTGATDPTVTNNTITYTITLEEGKTYAFDAVIENAGTYNAKLNSLQVTGAEDYAGLINYTVTGVAVGDTIAKESTKTMNVSVSMGTITNDNIGLLEGGKTLTLTVVAEFVQAD